MMVLLNLQQDLASLFAKSNVFAIFFDPSPMLIVSQSFLSWNLVLSTELIM